MNFYLIARVLGTLLLLEAMAMAACAAFVQFDPHGPDGGAMNALLSSAGVTGFFALAAGVIGRVGGAIKKIPRREAVAIVGLGWFLSSAFGGLPYLLCPPGLDVAEAIFEAASGFTTTGSSVIGDLEAWPRGLLLWRSVTQWLGGIGILVLFVAVLSYLGVGSKSLFRNESSFRSGEAGLARIHDNAMLLLKIYLVFSLVCMLGLKAMGLTWFNAILHTMATVSTGGFSPHSASVGFYSGWGNGWLIESWMVFFMTLCSLNFLLFVVILRKNWRRLRQEEDARWFLGICVVVIVGIAVGRVLEGQEDFFPALREAIFVAVSLASTSGFGTADYQLWPAWSQLLLALLMLMGGCAGSTSGGFKVGRMLVFLKSARHEIVRTFRPNQVFRSIVNGNTLTDEARARTIFFLTLFFMLAVLSTLLVAIFEAGTGISLETSAGAVIATLANIGPGFGEVGPTDNFSFLRPHTQVFLAGLMIFGRLELFAVLVLFFPSAWRKY